MQVTPTPPTSAPLPAKGPPRVPKVLRSAPPWCPLLSSRTYGRAPVPSAVAGKGQEPRAEPPRVAPGAGIPQQTPSCPPSTPGRTALQDICCIHTRARPYKSPIHAEENPTCCLGSGCPSCRLLPAPGREGRRRLEVENEPRSYKRVCGRSWTLGCPVGMGRKKWRGTHTHRLPSATPSPHHPPLGTCLPTPPFSCLREMECVHE